MDVLHVEYGGNNCLVLEHGEVDLVLLLLLASFLAAAAAAIEIHNKPFFIKLL